MHLPAAAKRQAQLRRMHERNKMIIKELIQAVQADGVNNNTEIILASDEEGNSFGRVGRLSLEKIEEVLGKAVLIIWPGPL